MRCDEIRCKMKDEDGKKEDEMRWDGKRMTRSLRMID